MAENNEKSSLRRLLLQKRDILSDDFMTIASRQIRRNLKKIEAYRTAESIACYYSIGSEVKTGSIIQDILTDGKTLSLPRIDGGNMIFCNVKSFDDLEKNELGIMEPKKTCPQVHRFDVVLVPAVAMTKDGRRLGYGMGFYDRFLAKTEAVTIALAYSKLVVRNIPTTDGDISIQWVVTEDDAIKTS
nr:5-formyltetrahydrofolate cyclo-ligase [Candidatus Nitrosotenuis cloacae]